MSAQIDQNWTPPDNFGTCTAARRRGHEHEPALPRSGGRHAGERQPARARRAPSSTGSERNFGWTGRGGGSNYGYFLSRHVATSRTGTLPNNAFERIGFRSNFNFVPDPRVKVDVGFNILQSRHRPAGQRQQHLRLARRRAARLPDHAPRRRRDRPGRLVRLRPPVRRHRRDRQQRRVAPHARPTSTLNYQPHAVVHQPPHGGRATSSRDEISQFFPKNDVRPVRRQPEHRRQHADAHRLRALHDRLPRQRARTLRRRRPVGREPLGRPAEHHHALATTRSSTASASSPTPPTASSNASTRSGGGSVHRARRRSATSASCSSSSRDRRFLQLGAAYRPELVVRRAA